MNGVKRRGKAQRRARRVHQKREEKKFERIPRAFPIHVAHMGGVKRG